ncbi:MAG: transaldolase family protein [Candidatus Thorarchaeota archaeon]
MRRLYLDSANIDDIAKISHTDAISGVTTNPSLMAKTEKGDYFEKLSLIAKVLGQGVLKKGVNKKHLSVEVITSSPSEMAPQAIKLWEHLKPFEQWIDLHIKIPVTIENLRTITFLERGHNIRVNATACMMPSQAKLAEDAGASVVSFFYNRMKDGGDPNNQATVREYADSRKLHKRQYNPLQGHWCQQLDDYVTSTIICGSIRKPQDIYDCWDAGAEAVTASMKIINLLMEHPQTDLAIKQFQDDIDKWQE